MFFLEENLLAFPAPQACGVPWFVVPSSIFKLRSLCLHISASSLLYVPQPSEKDPCDDIGHTQTVQYNLLISRSLFLITSTKFLLPCKLPYSQDHFAPEGVNIFGGHYSMCHDMENTDKRNAEDIKFPYNFRPIDKDLRQAEGPSSRSSAASMSILC